MAVFIDFQLFDNKMAAFDSEEIETVLDENETLTASPISQKHISSSSPKVVVKKWRVSQQLRP